MAGFTLFTGNRLERLAQELAMRTRIRPVDPFTPEIVVIQSRGMERWLALEIARHSGIAANLIFPFPEAFLRTTFERILPAVSDEKTFRREAMVFGVYAILPRLVDAEPAFDPIRAYLKDDGSGTKRIQLAEQIAHLFDQYIVFRPDLIHAWDEGQGIGDNPHQLWQAVLWRELTGRLGGTHRARLWQQMLAAIRRQSVPPGALPHRVSVFGISYLPPFYMQALYALSQVMTVDFYHLNPCREFWADIVSGGEEKRLRWSQIDTAGTVTGDDLHLEGGNRLLASMGHQGRAFHRLIGEFDTQTEDYFQLYDANTLLAAIQADILNLRNGPPQDEGWVAPPVTDRSVQIHACHSPMREIEVLYDQLLDLLNTDSRLEPRDILVLTTDIDIYAPYIQAVFGAPENEALHIPFSIADRGSVQCHPVVEVFFLLLELKNSRFPTSEILRLLEVPAVRARFDLSGDDMHLIEQWIYDTRIRWGTDAASKTRIGLPPCEENTWRAGLDRLLMGYALPSEGETLFKGILPAQGVEGSDAEAVGHLAHFIDTLQQWQIRLAPSRTPEAWTQTLIQLLDDFFTSAIPEEFDFQLLRQLIAEMRQYSTVANVNEPVDIAVVSAYLQRRLEDEKSGGGFISGGITFGALLPMRSIPAKVICLIGLNQDAFPREDRPLGFDLMATDPRVGDRSSRNDDKYLFLEALISARHTFYLSYIGFHIQDNTVMPPSVLVSDLIDYISDEYRRTEHDLVTRHRLQAFSQTYFNREDPKLFSYSRQSCEAAISLANAQFQPTGPQGFLSSPLSEWDASFQTVAIETLTRAVAHPCRFLLEQRLQLQLQEYRLNENDRESFVLNPLDRFALGQDLIRDLRIDPLATDALAKASATGRLPHGDPGRLSFNAVYDDAEEMVGVMQALQPDTTPMAIPVQMRLAAYTITGVLDNIFPTGQTCFRYSNTKGADLIGAWLRHLLWCRISDDNDQCVTMMIHRDGRRRFRKVDDPEGYLSHLLSHYHRAGHEPVPFFPRSSWDYAVLRFEKGYLAEKALDRVRTQWNRSFQQPGEAEEPYIQYCFQDKEPLDQNFVEITETIYQPIMQHMEIF